jgi:hypothetical protein
MQLSSDLQSFALASLFALKLAALFVSFVERKLSCKSVVLNDLLLLLEFLLLKFLCSPFKLSSVLRADELLSLTEVPVLLKCLFELILHLKQARACLLKFDLVVTCDRLTALPFLHAHIQLSQPLRIQLLIFLPFLRR